MSGSSAHFTCPYCGRPNSWEPELAGSHAHCPCGQLLTVPKNRDSLNETAEDEGELLLAPAPPPPPRRRATTIAAAPVVIEREQSDGSVQVLANQRTRVGVDPTKLMYHKRLTREKSNDEEFVFSMMLDGLVPAVLLLLGIAACFAAASYQGEGKWYSVSSVSGPVMFNIVCSLALVIGAVFAASAMGGVAFRESPALIIYKLCAIALAPGALGQLAQTYLGGINGDMAAVFVSLACYIALFVLLFKLAAADRVICVTLIFIIRGGVTYMIFRLQGAKQGLPI